MNGGAQHFVILAAGILIGLASVHGWRAWRALRQQTAGNTPAEEREYLRQQARRRLVSSALLVLLAGLLAGSQLLGLDHPADRLEPRANGQPPALSAEQRRFLGLYTLYWGAILVVLFVVIGMAILEIRAIRRHGARQWRQIDDDRQAMIEAQAARYRMERNGHS
ncbi:MAG: hypothetical protein NZ700_02145 [Gemmataceae bacterium]|nr:hypothetical protein [Gemmataceae bacterium]MDW8265272.1 hypothetical protein [Gemmataceae bacterium]